MHRAEGFRGSMAPCLHHLPRQKRCKCYFQQQCTLQQGGCLGLCCYRLHRSHSGGTLGPQGLCQDVRTYAHGHIDLLILLHVHLEWMLGILFQLPAGLRTQCQTAGIGGQTPTLALTAFTRCRIYQVKPGHTCHCALFKSQLASSAHEDGLVGS